MKSVYIHIPFCHKICAYCDFCKVLYNKKYISKYLESLKKEIKNRYKGEEIKTIYIGGGTPSSLDTDELDELLSIVSIFRTSADYEYTIECNIEDINIDMINLFKSYGVNRISCGVESFNKKNQEILNRNYDEDMIFDNIYLLKKYFDNINIDLIYAVSDDKKIVEEDIAKFLELDIPHVSCYSLILEEHTRLYIDKYKGATEEVDRWMYDYISSNLIKKGYRHYEISNYAKPGYESIHNMTYWKNLEYYGFGLGAVSYIDNYRISNTKNMTKYLNGNYLNTSEYEDIKKQKENTLMLGLRLIDGINIREYNAKYNYDLLSNKVIKELIDDKYLEVNKDNIKCNSKYIYLQNTILERIIDNL